MIQCQQCAMEFENFLNGRKFGAILADPPWQFQNRTGKVAPEHSRLSRYSTMDLESIKALPVAHAAADVCHLYLWVPNALLPEGLAVMQAWGFEYKSNLVWHKIRKDGGPDGRGGRVLFPQCHRIDPFRDSREKCSHARPRKKPSQFSGNTKARTLPQAG